MKNDYDNIYELIKDRDFYYNENRALVSSNSYQYDIDRCYMNILKYNKIIDLSHLEKLKANITIGKIIKHKPEIYQLLKSITKDIIYFFIFKNNIKLENLISIERDGIIIDKYIGKETRFENYIVRMKEKYNLFIRHPHNNKESLILLDDSVRLKGMQNKPLHLENFLFDHLNKNLSYNKSDIYNNMHNIIKSFYESNDLGLFMIPTHDNNYIVKCIDKDITLGGNIKIDFDSANQFNIDRRYYYQEYLYNYISVLASYYFNL